MKFNDETLLYAGRDDLEADSGWRAMAEELLTAECAKNGR